MRVGLVPQAAWAWRKRDAEEGRGMATFDHGWHLSVSLKSWFVGQRIVEDVSCLFYEFERRIGADDGTGDKFVAISDAVHSTDGLNLSESVP